MTGSEVGLADVLAHQTSDEREQALRALLMRQLLPGDSEDLVLVRRQSEYLRQRLIGNQATANWESSTG